MVSRGVHSQAPVVQNLRAHLKGHGVIIGGGIGGLLAAHALAHRFERVTILERFCYPPEFNLSRAPGAPRCAAKPLYSPADGGGSSCI